MKHFMKGRLLVVLAVCALLAVASPVQATIASALHGTGTPGGGSAQPMLHGADTVLNAPGAGAPEWNTFDGTLLGQDVGDAGFNSDYGVAPVAFLSSPFDTTNDDGDRLKGTITSEVYRHDDAHLLFVYTILSDLLSTKDIRNSNLTDWEDVDIIDAGEMTEEAQIQRFLNYSRYGVNPVTRGALVFDFASGGDGSALLNPGDISTHAYAETDATYWKYGLATVQDGSISVDDIPVLVPTFIPEPLTMVGLFMGLGGIGAYIRRRRMA